MKKNSKFALIFGLSVAFFAGCGDDSGSDNDKPACNYAGSKCNADGTALLTCKDGVESSQTCTCENNACKTAACDYEGSKCNENGTALLTCKDGVESSQACDCENNACKTAACDYEGSKCNENGTALLTCKDGVESSQACNCENNACVEEGDDCTYSGTQCDETGTRVMQCVKGSEEEVETCIEGCTEGKCIKVFCPSLDAKSCFDGKTALVCQNGEMVKSACEAGLVCADGECVNSISEVTCDFEKRCDEEKSGIQDCVDGSATYKACGTGSSCVSDASGVRCVETTTCENFRNYCTTRDGVNYAVMCTETSEKPFEKMCAASCVNGECTSNLTVGGACNPDSDVWAMKTRCSGNQIVECKNKVVTIVEDCPANGDICGQVTEDALTTAMCYTPCTTKGQVINECLSGGGFVYTIQRQCSSVDAGLGDGRLGYVDIQGSFNQCDIACKDGLCVDYTEDIEDIGKTCDPKTYVEYCKDIERAVKCMTDGDESLISAIKCDYDEICMVTKDDTQVISNCVKPCKNGSPDLYQCTDLMGNAMSVKSVCTKGQDGNYGYISDYNTMQKCSKGCDTESGKCK